MLSRCANPKCATPFEYHLGGKFYRFHQGGRAPHSERNTHEVVHFWLCPCCAEIYALDYDGTHCLLIPLVGTTNQGGSSEAHRKGDEEQTGDGSEDTPLNRAIAGRKKGAQR